MADEPGIPEPLDQCLQSARCLLRPLLARFPKPCLSRMVLDDTILDPGAQPRLVGFCHSGSINLFSRPFEPEEAFLEIGLIGAGGKPEPKLRRHIGVVPA